MARKQKGPELLDANGHVIKKQYKVEYWFDLRRKAPTPFTRGFPENEPNAIRAAGRVIMVGLVAKIQCTNRVTGKVVWTLVRGDRVPGTNLYGVNAYRGEVDEEERRPPLRRVV